MSVLIQYNNASFNLVNVYAPNSISDRKVFFEGLHDYFLSRGDLIIGGDFNCVENSIDKFRSNDIHVTDKKSLVSLKSDSLWWMFGVNATLVWCHLRGQTLLKHKLLGSIGF